MPCRVSPSKGHQHPVRREQRGSPPVGPALVRIERLAPPRQPSIAASGAKHGDGDGDTQGKNGGHEKELVSTHARSLGPCLVKGKAMPDTAPWKQLCSTAANGCRVRSSRSPSLRKFPLRPHIAHCRRSPA